MEEKDRFRGRLKSFHWQSQSRKAHARLDILWEQVHWAKEGFPHLANFARFGFDAAENEPCKVCTLSVEAGVG